MHAPRCIVITGGESGIGAACARTFGREGGRVAIFYHSDVEAARNIAREIEHSGGEAITLQCDVAEEGSVARAFEAVEQTWRAVDVLVNSAGVNMSGTPIREMDVSTWTRTVGTDLTGAFLVSRRFLAGPGYGQTGRSIIHISSIHAFAVRAGGGDYCAAKGGLTNLVKTLAVEEAENGCRVNAIEPGMILTPMNAKALNDAVYRQGLEQNIPMKRAGKPEEIAAIAQWLASDAAAYITGATIVADGGLSLLEALGA